MQNSIVRFVLSVLDLKYHFWVNLVQKVEIIEIRYLTVHLIFFILETLSLSKFGPKNQNCQFKLKFGT